MSAAASTATLTPPQSSAEVAAVKVAFLTQARPEMLARIPADLPHVVVHAGPDGTYAPDALAQLGDVDALLVAAEPVHDQLLDGCPKVKIVQRMGVGYNTLDLEACRRRGILEVRVVHGKGTGALRETVHAILERLPGVASFRLAGEDRGSWGATLVVLEP